MVEIDVIISHNYYIKKNLNKEYDLGQYRSVSHENTTIRILKTRRIHRTYIYRYSISQSRDIRDWIWNRVPLSRIYWIILSANNSIRIISKLDDPKSMFISSLDSSSFKDSDGGVFMRNGAVLTEIVLFFNFRYFRHYLYNKINIDMIYCDYIKGYNLMWLYRRRFSYIYYKIGLKIDVIIFLYIIVIIKGVFSYLKNQDWTIMWLKKGCDYIGGDYREGRLYTLLRTDKNVYL